MNNKKILFLGYNQHETHLINFLEKKGYLVKNLFCLEKFEPLIWKSKIFPIKFSLLCNKVLLSKTSILLPTEERDCSVLLGDITMIGISANAGKI